jgi:glycosyltransferase involved in cell wall biosynthesis
MSLEQRKVLPCYWDPTGLESLGSGIYQYGQNLYEALGRQGVIPTIAAAPSPGLIPWERLKICQGQRNYNHLRRRLSPRQKNIIYHGLANINLPLWGHRRNDALVLTVHDIIPLLSTQQSGVSWSYYLQFRAGLPRALARAARVVTVSQWTAQHLRERFPWCEEKLVVVPHGHELRNEQGRGERKERGAVLLSVSRYEGYKRFPLLLEIIRALDPCFGLRVVTNQRGVEFFQQYGHDLLAAGRLELYSQISDGALQRLYAEADILIHPSWYEGFCLPAAEALAAGVPLLYQKGTAIEEFAPSALSVGIGVGETSLDAWISGVTQLRQIKYEQKFQENLGVFRRNARSWDHAAREMREIYRSLSL